ncbi:uncharacterized protein DEA37_0002348 [Paragonimus westermani]|uniref:Cyclic nucleotide-binding domain-containing protein n=1 Tax=Paragonimus westermani TaxID=34504 RepID=A0A5J4NXC5_9TREM|nr:uncharacterized protein DEA37_0002348 [Paragonimus westermani]
MDESALNHIAAVLNKPPAHRLETETKQVADWLKRKVKLLEQVSMEILVALVKECGSETRLENELIIREGDIGDCMYILLSGSASVHQLCDLDQEREEKFSKFEKPGTPLCDSKISATERPSISCAERLGQIVSDFNELGPCVGTLRTSCIGDLELLLGCQPYIFSVQTTATTSLMFMNKRNAQRHFLGHNDRRGGKIPVTVRLMQSGLREEAITRLECRLTHMPHMHTPLMHNCLIKLKTIHKKQLELLKPYFDNLKKLFEPRSRAGMPSWRSITGHDYRRSTTMSRPRENISIHTVHTNTLKQTLPHIKPKHDKDKFVDPTEMKELENGSDIEKERVSELELRRLQEGTHSTLKSEADNIEHSHFIYDQELEKAVSLNSDVKFNRLRRKRDLNDRTNLDIIAVGQQRALSRGASGSPPNQLLSCQLNLERERTNLIREQITQFLLDVKLFQGQPTESLNRPVSKVCFVLR